VADVGVLLFFLFDKDSCVYWNVAPYCRVKFPVDFVVVMYFVVLSVVFYSLWLDLFYNVAVSTFRWMLTLF